MSHATTLHTLLNQADDQAPAILAPARPALSYGALRAQLRTTLRVLRNLGIARNERVAIVLCNGPEMASAFISIGAAATAAPLNPGYKADEFEFYLSDLNAKALVVEHDSQSPAIAVAKKRNIPIIYLNVEAGAGAGAFTLSATHTAPATTAAEDFAQAHDIALVLHTSGTTSRPKIVPLSQSNVCQSAANVCQTLALNAQDRGLVIMPLFHIHGLIAAVLAPLCAGSSIFCSPGFNALKFFTWMDEAKPSWYTAVPTMHQAILSRAGKNRDIIKKHPLRFIRSSSSALPPQVIGELEAAFDAPLIESYGMTEAAHQMTSNPLPPAPRKPGTVGIAAGPQVGIMSEDGTVIQISNTIGEIVIRGDNVTQGYENNAKANAEAFTHGWFRTGDQGSIDSEGYLSITGRLKEIINRGGEKISPREVDEILMDHPAVQQVVTFAVPHAKLGEDVAAAVVLKEGKQSDERELKDFAAIKLAAFKVPQKIIFLDEIPKGATGKLQRIGLAKKLGLA